MLITLVIIGIVAALTIPNLMQKYIEQTTVKKVQKFYSTLSNAYSLAAKENGPVNEWGLKGDYDPASTEKVYELLFKPYFKIAKNCKFDKEGNCFPKGNYKLLNNGSATAYNNDTALYKIVLDDGSSVGWRVKSTFIELFLDVNGHKGPNQWGKDTFRFDTSDKGWYPSGTPISWKGAFTTYCNKSNNGIYGCTAWVVYKGNMDYLHCDNLSWDGKDKCK